MSDSGGNTAGWIIGAIFLVFILLWACEDHVCDSYTGAARDRCIDAFQDEADHYNDRIPGRG